METAISGRRGGREGAGKAKASGDRAAGEQAHWAGRPQEQLPFVPPALSQGPSFRSTSLGKEGRRGCGGQAPSSTDLLLVHLPHLLSVPFLEGCQEWSQGHGSHHPGAQEDRWREGGERGQVGARRGSLGPLPSKGQPWGSTGLSRTWTEETPKDARLHRSEHSQDQGHPRDPVLQQDPLKRGWLPLSGRTGGVDWLGLTAGSAGLTQPVEEAHMGILGPGLS